MATRSAAKDVVRARVDPAMKAEASAVLKQVGLTVSDAFRMMLVRVVQEKRLPFEPFTPNSGTIAAMGEARAGQTVKAGRDLKAVMASLDE